MKKFRWKLNWSVENIYTEDGKIIPVWKEGKAIGKCRISIEGNDVVGNFDLTEELPNQLYVLYVISLPNMVNQRWLEGILLVGPSEGIEKRARAVENMENVK